MLIVNQARPGCVEDVALQGAVRDAAPVEKDGDLLHTVVQIRIQYQPAIRDYVARRTAEGKTSREIKRCLARYVARDLYRLLESGAVAA